MRFHAHVERTEEDLRQALAWAVEALSLQHWTTKLLTDDAARGHPRLYDMGDARAMIDAKYE